MPTPPGFADVSMRLNLSGFARSAYITYGVDPTSTDPDAIATQCVLAWIGAGSMNSRLDSTVTMAEVIVRLGTDGGEDLLGSAVNASVGGLTGGAPPPNVAVLMHKRTARGGRRGRGRLFLPWFCSDNDTNEDGTLLPALVTAVQTAGAIWLADLATRNVPMHILHSPGQTAEGPPNEVTSLVVSNLVATQRRRLGR
jgi:hypothetical protein